MCARAASAMTDRSHRELGMEMCYPPRNPAAEEGPPPVREYGATAEAPYAGEEPQQMSLTYMPWELVAGTPVADPANEPWPGGTPAQLASLGHPVTHVEESVKRACPRRRKSIRLGLLPVSPSSRSPGG